MSKATGGGMLSFDTININAVESFIPIGGLFLADHCGGNRIGGRRNGAILRKHTASH